jgi:hypothetical protein
VTAAFDPRGALAALNRHGVAYVLIGGFAANLLGAPLTTNDIDICYDRTPENAERLVAALRELHARLRVAGLDEDVPFDLHPHTILAGDSVNFLTDAGALDVRGTPAGTAGYADLRTRATEVDLGEGLLVTVVDLADLIRMKEASGRPKDRFQLEVLAALEEEIDGGP